MLTGIISGTIIGIILWASLYFLNKKYNLQFRHLFFIIFISGIIFRFSFTFFTPTFYAPDEEPHFKYVKYLYDHKSLPVQTSKTNEPTKDWEYYQPPLYYLILSLDYWGISNLSEGDVDTIVKFLRLLSIVMSIIPILFILKILSNLNLNDTFTKTFVASFLFLLPSYVFISSVINNDNLIIALSSIIYFLLTKNRYIVNSIYIGLLLGFAFLTKLTAFILLFSVVTFFLYLFITKKSSLAETLTHIIIVTSISIVTSLPMFLRNLYLYGDLIGESVANVRREWPSFLYGFIATVKYMVDSFWASAGIYYNIKFFSVFSLLITGLIIFSLFYNIIKNKDKLLNYLNEKLRDFLIPIGITIIVGIILIIRFGLLYGQGQGRFLFILLIPIAILVAINLKVLKIERFKDIPVHLVGFFLLYNTIFFSYCISFYQYIE